MRRIKAVVYGVGSMGSVATRMMLEKGVDIVGALARSPEKVGHDEHKEVPGTFSEHRVDVKAGTRLAAVVESGSTVTSHHHQALGRTGAGLVETAWADDGTLEGLEDPSRRFALGVQWHPEAGEGA